MMSQTNYMQRVGNSSCIRCDFETDGALTFEQQDAAMMAHLAEKHPDWMTDGGVSIRKDRLPIPDSERIATLEAQLHSQQEELERLTRELAFRDFSQARACDIALNYGPYAEIQKSLSSEIALHAAWTKRANEAEAELERLRWKPITEDNLPKVGDEVMRPHDCAAVVVNHNPKVLDVTGNMLLLFPTAALWHEQSWSHFRALNPPAAESEKTQ